MAEPSVPGLGLERDRKRNAVTDTLLILPDRPIGDGWFIQRSGARAIVHQAPITELEKDISGSYALVLPGQQVRAFLTDIPEKVRGSDRINIARFAHEDRVASDLDDLHIVVESGDPARTLMVGRDVMDQVLSQFDPTEIYVDFDLLTGVYEEPVRLLDRIVTPGPQGDAVDLDWIEGSGVILDDATLAQALLDGVDGALDLRSGPYRRRAKIQLGAWRNVAAGVLICAGLGLALSWAEIRAVNSQADKVRETARAVYAQATGDAAPANLARAIRMSGPTDADPTAFLQLSNQLFAAMAEHPDIAVERLSFDQQENLLRLRLIYPGFEAAGELEATVSNMGATLQTGGVREQSGQFIGDAALMLGTGS